MESSSFKKVSKRKGKMEKEARKLGLEVCVKTCSMSLSGVLHPYVSKSLYDSQSSQQLNSINK